MINLIDKKEKEEPERRIKEEEGPERQMGEHRSHKRLIIVKDNKQMYKIKFNNSDHREIKMLFEYQILQRF